MIGLKKKIIIIIVLMLSSTVAPAFNAQAQFIGAVPTAEIPLSPLLIAAVSTAAAVGVPGTGATVTAIDGVASAACQVAETAENIKLLETVDTFSGAFSFIGGSPAEAVFIQKKIIALTAFKLCKEGRLFVLRKVPTPTLIIGNDLARAEAKLNAELNDINKRLEDLKARRSATVKEVLKAIATKIVLGLSQKITTNIVNGLVAERGVKDFREYGAAVAGQVYATDYIRENYTDGVDQAIIRSLMRNEALPGNVTPMIKAKVLSNQSCIAVDTPVEDPNFYTVMAATGTLDCMTSYQQTNYVDQTSAVKVASQRAAELEISQGDGFIPPRNCNDTVSTQVSIDNRREAAQREYLTALQVEQRIRETAVKNKNSVKDVDIAKAVEAREGAQKKLVDLPKTNEVVVDLCQGITSPANFVSTSINNYLKTLFEEKSNLKSDNLPFWGKFIADMTSNFLNNIIDGNKTNVTTLVTEASFRTPGVFQSLRGTLANSSENLVDHEPGQTATISELVGQPSGGQTRGASTVQLRGTIFQLR